MDQEQKILLDNLSKNHHRSNITKQNLIEKVNHLQIVSRKLIQLHLQTVDAVILGLIHLEFDEDKRANFYSALQEILDF